MNLSFCNLTIQLARSLCKKVAWIRIWPVAALLLLGPTLASAKQLSTAIYYASNPPINVLAQFDRLVLESENVDDRELRELKKYGARTYAYLSIGESAPDRPWSDQIDSSSVLGQNSTWGSVVLDLTAANWQSLILRRVDQLAARGFDGLFLDTMDSYQLYADTPQALSSQEAALATLIRRIQERHPQFRLIANRGFEVLDEIATVLEAVAAESLFHSWDNNSRQYKTVSERDREWLLGQLNHAKDHFGLDVIAIDYLPPTERSTARDTATRIAKLGFTPWVATPALDYVGISTLEVIPREVLMIYDSRMNGLQEESDVHQMLAVPLEYMGYVPVYHDISTEGLPTGVLPGRYAGIVSWSLKQVEVDGFGNWMSSQIGSGIPVAMFSHPGFEFSAEVAATMGIEVLPTIDYDSLSVSRADDLIGFEAQPLPRVEGLAVNARSVDAGNSVHLRYTDNQDRNADVVVTGPWGGYAISPGDKDSRVDFTPYWVVDPFKFLRKALHLTDAPMPEVSTENGNRLWLAHIDGDAMPSWAEMPGRKLGAEIIEERILDRYLMPHTISIVEAELNALNIYDDRRDRMLSTARRIFASDHVEIATHTYSHPYSWPKIKRESGSGKYNLPVAGYRYNPHREIVGSAQYINDNLAPAGKKTEVVLWSGDALPGATELAIVEQAGMVNMNGGDTVISAAKPTLSNVSPMVRTVGDHLQIYAPIMNENVYTNEWTGPFDGFRRVIETLELTDQPRRLKPINIYYHFYAGTKAAMMRALEEVYEWTLTQAIFPVYVSEFVEKVPDFRSAGVARYLDGRWKVSGLGSVRTLRIVNSDRWPDLASSAHLVGAKQLHDGVYMHTNGADSLTFKTTKRAPTRPYLVSSNAAVSEWQQIGSRLRFRLTGNVPVVAEIGAIPGRLCSVRVADKTVRGNVTGDNTIRFEFSTQDTGYAVLDCPT
jgi:uncharacterized protein (TIGR01370 family)